MFEGTQVGVLEGMYVGGVVGILLGSFEGVFVGTKLGGTDGISVGSFEKRKMLGNALFEEQLLLQSTRWHFSCTRLILC